MDISFNFCPHAVAAKAASLRTGRRKTGGTQSRAYCLSALYKSVDAISTKDGKSRGNSELTYSLTALFPYSPNQLLIFVFFADLVVMAERLHPIPFRTRP